METELLELKKIGEIKKLVRYPVKSMAGIEIDESILGWHGLVGDRRFAVRRIDDAGSFPWLSASKLPELLLYQPCEFDSDSTELLPKSVQTPAGKRLGIQSNELSAEIGRAAGCDVELICLKHGIFDDASVSLISSSTASYVCHEAKISIDHRRFRANIEIHCNDDTPFVDDTWVGQQLVVGDNKKGPAVHITKWDVRCKMIGLDPDNAEHNPDVLKTAVRLNENNAGVYGTVIRTGTIKVNDPIFLNNPQSF